MDLNTISTFATPIRRSDLGPWREGDAWLAGGTWLFSQPQPALKRLIDLTSLDWPPLTVSQAGLEISATCTLAQLAAFRPPASWIAASLFGQCCRALLGSFKICNTATVGGNICLALPAAPMIALATALEATCTIWTPSGDERTLAVPDLVIGPQLNALHPSEVLRRIDIPATSLSQRTAFRRISLTSMGRSAALLIGTRAPGSGAFAVTVTASTRRPVRLAFPRVPDEGALRARMEQELPGALYHDDVHGHPDWRRHVTLLLADEIRSELANEGST